jgi:ATP adenylyltransferase/5',5'''-P-1,P-4-tetraphosphate phosphorylase II
VGAALSPAFDKSRKWGPGSDMFCPDERMIITKLNGGTHDLALNLFCVDRPQLLMLTTDSYKRQYEALDGEDFKAILEVIKLMPSMYVIYNCSETGGCSRMHKHMQGLRGPPFAFESLTCASEKESKVPFQYFTYHFSQGFAGVSAGDLLEIYNRFLSQARTVLGLNEHETIPHNVVLWKDAIIVIPRRKGVWEGASANTGGMMGSVWVPNEAGMDKWTRLGCANVLRELGVPR